MTVALLVGATACSSAAETAAGNDTTADASIIVDQANTGQSNTGQSSGDTAGTEATTESTTGTSALWDSSVVHSIEVDFDQDDYDAMIAEFSATADKTWITATVTVDGSTYENVGLRLKGNSSLFGLTEQTAENPEDLPWLIRLDKYEDDQNHDGWHDIVIRSNSTETALNEAIAAELLDEAGLASQQAIATTLQVNDGDIELRLAMQNPDGVWEDANFDSDTAALYKAESTGDYTYRGDDPDAYDDVFDQESGSDDLEPLIDFLEFINNTDDTTFAAELSDRLDVESFATYLAFQDLIGNGDDIDGRGNNSYLHYSYDTETFTVVNWDLNLAFGTANVGGGGPGAGGGGRGDRPVGPPPGATVDAAVDVLGGDAGGPAAGGQGAGGPAAGGQGAGGPAVGGQAVGGQGAGGSNVLSSRFLANADFAQLYADATAALTEALFTNGVAGEIVSDWVDVLAGQNIVDAVTVQADADAVVAAFPVS